MTPSSPCFSAARAAAWAPAPVALSPALNVSQIADSPEPSGVFLGSPSLLRLPGPRTLLATHDEFGPGTAWGQRTCFVRMSNDEGQSWSPANVAAVADMYWATLFRRASEPAAVYLLGVSDDGNVAGRKSQATIARSLDGGLSWSPAVFLTGSATASFSTGPTPVLESQGRIWRAFEHNVGAGWASGYAVVVLSAPAHAPDLLDPAAWTASGELPFVSVLPFVPPSWARPGVVSAFGWLEGGAVEHEHVVPGIAVMLRVNSLPAANKAALVTLSAPDAVPAFGGWVDFPGGMTKFSVRRDNVTGLYVTLSNNVSDESVSSPPACAALPPQDNTSLPCCGFLETCVAEAPGCVWCHAVARNVLTLAVSTGLSSGWRVVKTLLADDSGLPAYLSELLVGFQYVDWQFDGDDLIYAVRAAYRGANQYHNANRHLFGAVPAWRSLL